MAHDAEQFAAAVSGQAVNKQAEEDGGQDLAEQDGQARLAVLARRVQEANQGDDTWGGWAGWRRGGGGEEEEESTLKLNSLNQPEPNDSWVFLQKKNKPQKENTNYI